MLTSRGHDVRGLVRKNPGPKDVVGELENVGGFVDALAGCDAIIHNAAALPPVDDERADALNHRASVELAKAGRERGVSRYVFVSSVAAIGFRDGEGLIGENARCTPQTPYGRSKRAAEESLLALDGKDLRVAIARPPTVYGPGDRGNFMSLVRSIDSGKFLVPGRGDNRMSFCHVENLALALALLAERDDARGIYHVADARPVTLRETAVTIAKAAGRRLLPVPFPMPVARATAIGLEVAGKLLKIEPPLSRIRLNTITSDWAFDTAKLETLGYRAPVEFLAGTQEAIRWYRTEGLLPSR
jgi:nucleoside-diphosphate-sugar epimerase